MAHVAKRIIAGSQLTGSAATYYTAPANTKCIVKRLTLCNTSATPATATIYLIASGGSASDSNTITKTKTLYPAETWSCPDAEGHVLEAGGFIQALASAATSITIIGSGVEVT
jgi:hypothetical protein